MKCTYYLVYLRLFFKPYIGRYVEIPSVIENIIVSISSCEWQERTIKKKTWRIDILIMVTKVVRRKSKKNNIKLFL